INPAYAELKESDVLSEVEFFSLPKGIEILTSAGLMKVGDFRRDLRYLPDLLSGKSGTFLEKLRFLNYLRKVSANESFGVALSKSPILFNKVLKPFLDGVFLSDSAEVSNRMARELVHWFIKGSPGIPSGGVREVSEKLAAGIDIEFNSEVKDISATEVLTRETRLKADAVINALDPISSAKLMKLAEPIMSKSTTWYFQIESGLIESKHLRAGGTGPLVNSVVISNSAPSYAPKGSALIAATTLGVGTETEVRAQLMQHWQVETKRWNLISKYEIPNSLPFHPPQKPLIASAVRESGIYVAGDWRATPSQQGALLSGRLAANAIISGR
ncbi:MAG: hypothetical protein RL540_1407, partial [Actinomycetota bacterium]